MDIAKFNRLLGAKIAKAKAFERNNDKESAIELWIEISDLVLKASKQPSIDFSYKNMLISKTEQIITHIKNLKTQGIDKTFKEERISQEFITEENEPVSGDLKVDEQEEVHEQEKVDEEKEIEEWSPDVPKQNVPNTTTKEIIEDTDVSILHDGIKEIEAPKEFKIITPHDPDYIEKMKNLSKEENFMFNKAQTLEASEESNDVSVGKGMICFTCGKILPIGSKVCTECGAKLIKE
jgi:hypothetical protein